ERASQARRLNGQRDSSEFRPKERLRLRHQRRGPNPRAPRNDIRRSDCPDGETHGLNRLNVRRALGRDEVSTRLGHDTARREASPPRRCIMAELDINGLGDQIATLTLKQAVDLANYLKEKHGIEPAAVAVASG